jgi:hypothetical protein
MTYLYWLALVPVAASFVSLLRHISERRSHWFFLGAAASGAIASWGLSNLLR